VADALENYAIPSIPAGSYSVTISAAGFQPVTVPGVEITAGQPTTLNRTLTANP